MFEIKSRWNSCVLFSLETKYSKLAVEAAVKSGADLSGADLFRADLSGARIIFGKFPSIKTLALINLAGLSDKLSLELMRRDAAAHPYPERFDIWAKGGDCPYQDEERFWIFDLKKELWKKGKPKLSDVELIRAICAEKGWKIKEV